MFDLVTKSKLLVYTVLGLIILTFAFFGVDSYFRGNSAVPAVATIGDGEVSEQEFGISLRQAQDRLREQARDNPQMSAYMNSPEFRRAVLDEIIQRRLLLGHANALGMKVSPDELLKSISGIRAFYDEDGKFSVPRFEQLLRAQNLTPAGFERQLEQDLVLGRVQNAFGGSAFLPKKVVERLVRIRGQEREVSQVLLSPADFKRNITVTDEDAKKYFDDNRSLFQIPERARIEYLILTPEAASASVEVGDDELRAVYTARLKEFQTPEERRASHILVPVATGATDEEKAASKTAVEDIHQQLMKSPRRFAELARAHSQDPGSAELGGDLGFFQRGFMVKEFDAKVFELDINEISLPVLTQYGYHIIRLDKIKATRTTPFEQVKSQLLEEIRKTKVQDAYLQAAQTFSEMVFTEYDSLKPTADALNLTVQTSDWISPAGGGVNPLLNNPKLLEALFSAEGLQELRNTEAIEVQPNTLLSARVIEHKDPTNMPYEDVSKDILDHLGAQQAVEIATRQGEEALAKLEKGEQPKLKWSKPGYVTLQSRQGLHADGVRAVFGADVSKLPVYKGVSVDDGRYVIYRISKVREIESVSPEDVETAAKQLSQMAAQQQHAGFVGSLRERAKVSVNEARLLPEQQ